MIFLVLSMFAYFTEKKVLCCKSLNVHAQIMQSCRKATKSDHLAPFCLSSVVSEGSSVFVLSADERSQLKLSHFIQSGSSNLQRPLVTSHTPTNTAAVRPAPANRERRDVTNTTASDR